MNTFVFVPLLALSILAAQFPGQGTAVRELRVLDSKRSSSGVEIHLIGAETFNDTLRMGSCPPGATNMPRTGVVGSIGHLGASVRVALRVLPNYKGTELSLPTAEDADGHRINATALVPTVKALQDVQVVGAIPTGPPRPGDKGLLCEFVFYELGNHSLSLKTFTMEGVTFDLAGSRKQ
jgi:hypothetical protein